jgi:hypothetical protein
VATKGAFREYLSALENSPDPVDPGRDKLVRFTSGDRKLKDALMTEDQIEKWLTSIQGRGPSEKITATWPNERKWRVQADPIAA